MKRILACTMALCTSLSASAQTPTRSPERVQVEGAQNAPKANCNAPVLYNGVQMIRNIGSDTDLVFLDFTGNTKTFLLATGSYQTMISGQAATALGFSIVSSDVRALAGMTGVAKEAQIPKFSLGDLGSDPTRFHIAPDTRISNGAFVLDITKRIGSGSSTMDSGTNRLTDLTTGGGNSDVKSPLAGSGVQQYIRMTVSNTIIADNEVTFGSTYQLASHSRSVDGIFGLDYILRTDADLDFGTDVYQMFSTDHCTGPGAVFGPVKPSSTDYLTDNYSLRIPVVIDGHKFYAMVDTSSNESRIRADVAQAMYSLSPGNADTPAYKMKNANAYVPTFIHTFKSMKFGDVEITNPRLVLVPNTSGAGSIDKQFITGSLFNARQKDLVAVPQVVLGMNVLRQLHLYIARVEQKIYIAPASPPDPVQLAKMKGFYKQFVTQRLIAADAYIAMHPKEVAALNEGCWGHASIKANLDVAMNYCDAALKLEADNPDALEGRALVLYQQGKYAEALSAYDAILAKSPSRAQALLLRGWTKGRLGDGAGLNADVAAASAIYASVEAQVAPYDLSP